MPCLKSSLFRKVETAVHWEKIHRNYGLGVPIHNDEETKALKVSVLLYSQGILASFSPRISMRQISMTDTQSSRVCQTIISFLCEEEKKKIKQIIQANNKTTTFNKQEQTTMRNYRELALFLSGRGTFFFPPCILKNIFFFPQISTTNTEKIYW